MLTQMYSETNISKFYGLSTDTKPTDCPNGSKFYEINTGKIYRFDKGSTLWVEQATSGSIVEESVGKKTASGGEIFNDYENNQAGTRGHAEGVTTTASGDNSHAEGASCTASGDNAHAEGAGTTASGLASHAENSGTTASGNHSHAQGTGTIAASTDQHAMGRYNVQDAESKYAFIIGNGTADERSDAFAVDWDGKIYIGGSQTGVDVTQISDENYTTTDKTKLAGIESGANKTVVDDRLDATSTNPVQNKTIVSALRNGSPVHYGFKIDKNNSDPFTCVTYLYDNVGFTPAAMDYTNEAFNYGSWADAFFIKNSYPVALKFDGTEDYKLDPNDYSKKLDGTASDVTDPTYHGNFMVAFPTVWFKRYDDGDYNYVEISDVKLGDDWFAYAHTNANGDVLPYIYLPLYKGSLYDGKLRSISGAAPQNNTTADEEVSYAAACGQGWQIWDWSSRELINDLLILIGKSTDCQTTFGAGQESGYDAQAPNNGILNTGSLDDKGAFYGYNTSLSDVKVFGIGGFWASRWERLQGLMLVNDVWKAKMTPAYNFTGAGFATPENAVTPSGSEGYVKSRNTSAYGSIPAANSGASQTTYVCDYSYKNASGTRVAVVGGGCSVGRKAGCFCVSVSNAASSRYWSIGASAVYKSPR